MLRRIHALARSRRPADGAVVAVGVLVLAPYVLAGAGLFVDDWFALRNAVVGEWWDAAGPDQWRARPGAGVVYALSFGLIGARPGIHAALAAVVLLITAVVLRRVLVRYVPPIVALAISLSWLLVPNHTSLEVWPSALNIALSLLLALLGVERLLRGPTDRNRQVTSALLLAASVLTYEATAPVLVLGVAAVAWCIRADRTSAVRLVVVHSLAVGASLAWMVVNWHPSKTGLGAWLDPIQVVNGHVGTGVVGEHVGAAVLGAVVLVTSVVAAYLAFAGRFRGPEWVGSLLLAGWVLVVVGALPFVRYFYSPVGLGDRVTVVSGVGGAMVLVATVGWIGTRQSAIASVLAVLAIVGAIGHRASLVADYATAADDSRRILDAVRERWPEPPEEPIVFGPHPVVKRNIVAFIDADWPLQWMYADRSVIGAFTLTAEAFDRVSPEQRVDLVELSELESTDRLVAE